MSASNFDLSLSYVLKDEGGNADDPQDHGGRTSRGITQREYNSWCNLNGKPSQDVWLASNEDVKQIYKSQYWEPYCDKLPNGIDYLFFDISVNCGRTQATRQLQKALGDVNVDGMLGQVTLSHTRSADPTQLIHAISEVRRDFYRSLRQFSRYGRGWLSRVDRSEEAALAMLSQQTVERVQAETAKATEPVQPAVSPEVSGLATGGVISTLTGFKDQISGLTVPHIDLIIFGIAVIGLGYTVYSLYLKNKIAKAI